MTRTTIYDIDRRTGHVRWRLGGKQSDFALGDGVAFSWQHNPTAVGERTLRIFDNHNSGAGNAQPSRVIWVRLDPRKRTATLVRAFEHPEKLSAPSQGNAQGLEDGDTFVGWGALGRISEFDRFGRLRFDASVPKGYETYRAYRERWWGRPTTPPTATAARASDGSIVVHAVWNGATDVARWRVLGGGAKAALAPIATSEWNGLDTAIELADPPAFVQVVAEDRHGRVLGISTVISSTP